MFDWIINSIAGSYNERQIKILLPLVSQINALYNEFDILSDDEIKLRSTKLKEIISKIPLQKKIKDKDGNLILNSISSPIDEYLPEAFALVKQACKRLIGTTYLVKGVEQIRNMVPYDVQIIWAINLHRGKISEMRTGEGKTLVATMPAYLNALNGRGVHIVTVNDYLASRDSDQMRIVFEFLGLTVGCVTKAIPPHMRRAEYEKDITYVENSELGFDYLRDNLVKSLEERNVLRRPFNYAIVDEIDSILIDESRTPLIISEPDAEPTEKYTYYAQIVPLLIPSKNKKKVSKGFLHDMLHDAQKETSDIDEWDYHIDEKTKTIALSSQGIAKLEKILNVENLYKDLWYDEIHHIENALKANACYINGKEYLVNNGEILIIDENTGRAQAGRRFSQGLHQAIEAKEKVTIQKESKTLATITYQNFFKLYHKICGMTGTATTEGEEFDSIYNLHVLAIPTNKDVIRVDKNDRVYFNQHAKRHYTIEHIMFAHEMGQPLLIGTSSITTSEFVSSILTKNNVTHSVLNAKFHEQEAQIISHAGKYNSVVVATNMAGRGTDIKLEEWLNNQIAKNYVNRISKMTSWNNKEKKQYLIKAILYSSKEFELTIDALKQEIIDIDEDMIIKSYKSNQTYWDYKMKISLNTKKKFPHEYFAEILIRHNNTKIGDNITKEFYYGLGIIGTEKHESRRIDNQLRGRAWRQGDPGMSVFYVALDDSIMRKMWWEKIQGVASLLLPKSELETLELTQAQFTSSIIRAQKQMEWRHFGIRKHLFDYDSVIDKQRQSIYTRRDGILHAVQDSYNTNQTEKNISPVLNNIISLIEKSVKDFVTMQYTLWVSEDELIELINKEYGLILNSWHVKSSLYNESIQHISAHIISKLNDAKIILWEEIFTRICANIHLNMIDKHRVAHIDEMQYLREQVGLMWYAQLDPLVIYKKESYDKYQALNKIINQSTVSIIANTDFNQIAEHIKFQQQQQMQIIGDQNTDNKLIEKLKSAARQAPVSGVSENKTPLFTISSNQEFEIIEMNWEKNQGSYTNNQKTKIRPNDKVNVRHSDGRMEFDIKYKKVVDEIKNGKCQII